MVWHYTTVSAFRGIVHDRAIRLKRADLLKDTLEWQLARRYCRRTGLDSVIELADGMSQWLGAHTPFIASFSRVRDDPHQWAEYGDRGRGVALGVSVSALREDAKAKNFRVWRGKDRGWAGVLDVTYDFRRTYFALSELDERSAFNYGPHLFHGQTAWWHAEQREADLQFCETLFESFVELSLATKRRRFAAENEVRYALLAPRADGENGEPDFRLKSLARLAQRPDIPLPAGWFDSLDGVVVEVLLGPRCGESATLAAMLDGVSTAPIVVADTSRSAP